MKRALQIAWVISIILLLAIGFKSLGTKSIPTKTEQIDIRTAVDALEAEAKTLAVNLSPIGFDQESHSEAVALRKKRWYIFQIIDNELTYWNSNKIGIDSSILNSQVSRRFYTYGDDLYILFRGKNDTYFAFRLANDKQLHPRLSELLPNLKNKELSKRTITSESSQFLLSVNTKQRSQRAFLNLILMASFIFLMLALWYAKLRSIWLYVAATFVCILNITTFLQLGYSAESFFLIASNSIASKSALELNVLLYIHLMSIVAACLILFSLLKKLPDIPQAFLSSLALFFLADFFLDLNAHLVHRSTIPFDFEKLFNLSSTSFSALSFVCLTIVAIWLLVHYTKLASLIFTSGWIAILAAILAFSAFQYWDAHRSLMSLLPPVLVIGASIFIYTRQIKPRWTIYLFFILTALLTATIVWQNHEIRNEEIAKDYAIRLVNNEDTRAEQILQTFENQLAQEFLVPADYQNFIDRKEIIESRLKHLYFSNYLEKYELKIFSFDPAGKNINGSSLYDIHYLDSVFNTHATRTSSAYFYRLDNVTDLNGYIAKYENCDIDDNHGSTYILLQPRVVQSEFLYPEIFKNQEDIPQISTNDYSFGLYFDNKLVSQRGSYPYKLTQLPSADKQPLQLSEVQHYTYSLGQYKVVLSKRENELRSWLSTLTFTIVLLLLIGILCSIAAYILLGREHNLSRAFLPFTNRFLSTRIQTSLTIILLVGLLLSVYIIIGFIQANYNQNLEDQLLNKVKSISATLQNKVNLAQKIANEEQRTLILNEESSTYNVDINLYSPKGILLGSTKPYLSDEQILGSQMNPNAYVQLINEQSSQLLTQEELEGSDYLSAYIPLFDDKSQVLGYVNTPFFARNEELNKQVSNLVVNIINIYFLLLLGGVLLAYIISRQISKPLLLIREKIAKTELRGSNELIVYNKDDEIGLLVKQYNKMVLELEESANQMAESEREGAWREMAKQVAHEIKNPLTPMKLSVQHLQRAYTNGPSEKLDALFAKTSKLIIEQIESLSNMASEFSTFAKMPEDKFEVFNISNILLGTTDLFKQSENVEIKAKIAPEVYVNADPEQIRRVFNNLIKNAIQAIPEERDGKIEIELKVLKAGVRISIKDNGKGIPLDNYKKVFVPNFSTKNSGMGLGLAICRKIVETAKGEISFTSEINLGTTFTVILPKSEKA